MCVLSGTGNSALVVFACNGALCLALFTISRLSDVAFSA